MSWDNDYSPVKQDENSCSATCRISVDAPDSTETQYFSGILAYNKELLVYVAVSFENYDISDSVLVDIAESIVLNRNLS